MNGRLSGRNDEERETWAASRWREHNALRAAYFPVIKEVWAEKDSNLRRRKPVDLQSTPFGHFGIYPAESIAVRSRG